VFAASDVVIKAVDINVTASKKTAILDNALDRFFILNPLISCGCRALPSRCPDISFN
jgi:hypothetical protein